VLVDSEKIDVITYTKNAQNQWIIQYFMQNTDKTQIVYRELFLEIITKKWFFSASAK